MPSVVATVKVKEGKVEEARAFMKELASETLANEAGTLAYVVHQRRDDPLSFVVYEKYEDAAAFATHGKNLGPKAARFGAILDGPPQIVMLEEI